MRYLFYREQMKKEKGFTLIEILITMAIVGILAGIAVPMYLGQRTKAMRTEAQNNVESLRLIMEQYYNENACYYKSSGSCGDTTLSDVDDIKDYYTSFKPGDDDDMQFDYSVSINNSGANYHIVATGKTDSPVDGVTICNDRDNTDCN